MTSYEFEILRNKGLSHEARTLYAFYLRPQAIMGPIIIDSTQISDSLTSYSQVCPFNASFEMCQDLLDELAQAGLIECFKGANEFYDGHEIRLPFLEKESLNLPQMPFFMHANWRPGPSFVHAAKVSGLIDPSFSEKDLQGFINYWSQKAEKRNQIAWERAFVQRLIRMRQSANVTKTVKVTQRTIKGYDVFGNPQY